MNAMCDMNSCDANTFNGKPMYIKYRSEKCVFGDR